jgi:polyisoprenoid-binding protein YceI
MLRLTFKLILFFSLSLCIFSCKNDKKTEAISALNVPTMPAQQAEPELTAEGATTYKVTEGVVNWQGRKTVTNTKHYGTLKVASGEILVKEGRIVNGTVKIDMKSLSVTDLQDPKEKTDLEGHLKSADFFEVEKYPEAIFTIEDALPSRVPGFNRAIAGTLTMKGKTNTVNIPVNLTIDNNSLTANSVTFQIQRTDWGINFGTDVVGTVKNKVIDNIILLSLTLTAKP